MVTFDENRDRSEDACELPSAELSLDDFSKWLETTSLVVDVCWTPCCKTLQGVYKFRDHPVSAELYGGRSGLKRAEHGRMNNLRKIMMNSS
jgi:hypothetical protein